MMVFRTAVCAVLALLLGMAPFSSARAADPLELYALLPMTGPLAFLGQGVAASMGAEEAAINARGGVNDRTIRFTMLDDQGNPQVAVQLLAPLLSKGVPAIIDSGPAATCRATTAAAKSAAVIYCLSNAYDPAADSYSFATPMSLEDAIAAQIRFLRVRGLRRIGFIITTDATGQASDAAISNILAYPENRDVVAVARERFGMADISVTAQIARIRSAGAQAVYALASGAPFALVLRELRDAGMSNVPTATLASNQSIKQLTSYGNIVPPDLEMVTARFAAYDVMGAGPVKDDVGIFRSALAHAGVGTDGPASLPWDPIMLILAAYRKYDFAPSAANVRDFIAGTRNVPGIDGFYDFITAHGYGLTSKDTVVLRWDAARKDFVPISTAGGVAVLHK